MSRNAGMGRLAAALLLLLLCASPAAAAAISGTVFEDVNYGGGAGRSFGDSSGVLRQGAIVELYDGAGAFQLSTTTDASGNYSFPGLSAGNYTVRVVNSTVTSSRAGYVAGLLPVQTFRTDASTGSVVAVTDRVGGQDPAAGDGGVGGAGTVMDTTTGAFTAGITGMAQSIAPVTLGATDIAGVDFGSSFNVVVNVNDAGQGSLRQVMANCQTLGGEALLALAGRPAGSDVTIFMLADGTARPGLTPAYPSLFTGGVATIDVLSPLPVWAEGFLDAQTQPGWTLDPIVELNGQNAGAVTTGIRMSGGAVRGFIINRFGGNGINRTGGTGLWIEGNWIGVDRTGTAAAPNGGDGIYIDAGGNHSVGMASASIPANRNVVSGNLGHGIHLRAFARVYGNRVGTDAAGSLAIPNGGNGMLVQNANAEIGGGGQRRNVISANALDGIRIVNGACGASCGIFENVVGRNLANTAPLPNGGAGIRVQGAIFPITTNIVADNGGPGIVVSSGAGNTISQNTIFGNDGLGIDLLDDGLTSNDPLDIDTGPNDLLNFPTITSVFATGGTLTAVFSLDVPAGTYRIEFFKNPSGADASGYGEGEVFAGSRDITHPGVGSLSFFHSFPGNAGDGITATTTACTSPGCTGFGSTSEFGNALTAVATAVKLMSFAAVPGDGSVTVEWRTGSELDNLGFHLYRGLSPSGPWTRLTQSPIPGLGSSPIGRSYTWLDGGLANGVKYYYRLEDVDTASVSNFHGPVSAVPQEAVPSPSGGGGGGSGGGSGGTGPTSTTCPSWVLSAPGTSSSGSLTCTKHGNPDAVSFQVLSRDARGATVELRTGGFWALREASGTVRVFVPGFDTPMDASAPALPLRRALVDAEVGKKVLLVSAEALDLRGFKGLRPSAVGVSEMVASWDGTVRAGRRAVAAPRLSRGYLPQYVARLAGTVFQGETKSAIVEMTPVRFDGYRQQLVLASRVRVRLAFTGRETEETGSGSTGRVLPRTRAPFREVLAQLHTTRRGLHAVGFEELFPVRLRGIATSQLRLQRQGQAVAFHVEPSGAVFGPGSTLYFFADKVASSTDYSSEVAWELVRSASGQAMEAVAGTPLGGAVTSSSLGFACFETNRIYQAGLLEAEDVWLWQALVGGTLAQAVPFTLSGVDTTSSLPAQLVVYLQGGSASGVVQGHHVQVSLNGALVGEGRFAGKKPYRLNLSVAASQLVEGANTLRLLNVGDTGVSSLVFLDKVTLVYPQATVAVEGVFEGTWGESGTVEVGGVAASPVVLDVTDLSAVKWVTGFVRGVRTVRYGAEAAHRYVVSSREGLLSPRIERPLPSTLRDAANQADYLLIAPRGFLAAAEPLLAWREGQGLTTMGVAFEEIAETFGHGQPSAEAIRDFLTFACHSWTSPSPRYVLLLGDSTYDPRHFLATSWASPLPALWAKTSYLWTASDPALAAVNGTDGLPDLAIGRLPAQTPAEAQMLVAKLLAWEGSAQTLDGNAVLVADNPDEAGNFEGDVEDIRGRFLSGRSTEVLKLRELGASTRPAILDAFNAGASLMSYVGHGGAAVWASENVWNSWDTPSLLAQSRQPLLLTMNCLNGYFVAPNFDSLSEALLKAEGRGAIAALSPSGLSFEGQAHQYHRAVVAQLVSGAHTRLGDAILAAQKDYAQAGLFPELLTVYHLLGDPATKVQ